MYNKQLSYILVSILERYNAVDKYVEYYESANESCPVKIHSLKTLTRYLNRSSNLKYIDILEIRDCSSLDAIENHIKAIVDTTSYVDFFNHYIDKIPTEIIEVIYFNPVKFAKFVYFNYIIYWLFDARYYPMFPDYVENIAYYILNPNDILGTNIKFISNKYKDILDYYGLIHEYEIELITRLIEFNQQILECTNTNYLYVTIDEQMNISILKTDINNTPIECVETTFYDMKATNGEVLNTLDLDNCIIISDNSDYVYNIFITFGKTFNKVFPLSKRFYDFIPQTKYNGNVTMISALADEYPVDSGLKLGLNKINNSRNRLEVLYNAINKTLFN